MESAKTATPSTPRIACISWKTRSEEHTSELQSRLHLVCRLLLEKKKNSVDKPARFEQCEQRQLRDGRRQEIESTSVMLVFPVRMCVSFARTCDYDDEEKIAASG